MDRYYRNYSTSISTRVRVIGILLIIPVIIVLALTLAAGATMGFIDESVPILLIGAILLIPHLFIVGLIADYIKLKEQQTILQEMTLERLDYMIDVDALQRQERYQHEQQQFQQQY